MLEDRFSSEYREVVVNGQKCFMSNNGTVFYFIVLEQLRSLVVEYADTLEDAKESLFEDGDQFDIDQGFEELVDDIKSELLQEAA